MCAASVKFPCRQASRDIRCWGAAFLGALMLGLSVAVYLGYHSQSSAGFISNQAFVLQGQAASRG